MQNGAVAGALAAAAAADHAAAAAAGCTAEAAVGDAAGVQLAAEQREVCQLLAALAVMLRLGSGAELPAALAALRRLPELPQGDARGLCSLCGHYEALCAYAVRRRGMPAAYLLL